MRFPKLDLLLYFCNRVVARVPSHIFRLFFYREVMKFKIEQGSHIFMDAWFDAEACFQMGRNSVINQKCRLDNRGGISIGSNVSISAEVIILTADHDPASPTFEGRIRSVVLEDYAFIGTRAMILPGVTVHRGGIVAAGAIVTKDVEVMSIVAGIPARKIGDRNPGLEYTSEYGRPFC